MGQVINLPEINVIEAVSTPTIYADGVAKAVIVGDAVHMVLYADYASSNGEIEAHVAGRVIMKIDVQRQSALTIATAILKSLAERGKEPTAETANAMMMQHH